MSKNIDFTSKFPELCQVYCAHGIKCYTTSASCPSAKNGHLLWNSFSGTMWRIALMLLFSRGKTRGKPGTWGKSEWGQCLLNTELDVTVGCWICIPCTSLEKQLYLWISHLRCCRKVSGHSHTIRARIMRRYPRCENRPKNLQEKKTKDTKP